ncbi:trafficking protein particle complex subunit 10 [Nilaparvata lugens]|uniref:trafficking protein particle complex subunit 10 n=1 Tax=Nilaparvata lugens TaxID=108931 RepID=UPI00193E803C|nr:trafficking protein particle complex subunit 10 [Nilaparvata lugens]
MNQVSNVNGISDGSSEISIVDRKPIITYAGDKDLFLTLEPTLVSSLPQEPTEWRRAYGRAVKSVHVAASFVPFSKEVIPGEGDYCLIQQPVFHTYWTQCSDVDTYKATLRDDIDSWMKTLGRYKITDWMIVVVETYDFRKTNKLLPRTTVLDKIKNDFGTKHADRCLSVINPLKSESRSAGSWRGLMVNMRLLLLAAYDKTLLRFEEVIREQREKRNQPGWSFCKYFLLQEELAFVLEMLGIYDEALVQYDELDALFTQFVLNSNFGDIPEWLAGFQGPLQSWPGLTLKHKVNNELRSLIQKNKISLLQFRSYLFSRQCSMLLFSFKPWEVAQRTLQFLHNCINELNILEVTRPPGAVACWVFLCCREVLQTCEKFNDSGQIEAYSLYTAALWAYARDKLNELGELCGLMPGCEPSSSQLHTVVLLSAGIGDTPATHPAAPSPTDHLKQALSSKDAFRKQYLELSELAMGTYKHIGRTRSANLIGRELSAFHWRLGDLTAAATFLVIALRCYQDDNWPQLVAHTRLQLADCYRQMPDHERLTKMCCCIASSKNLDESVRLSHFEEAQSTLREVKPDPHWLADLGDSFSLVSVGVQVVEEALSIDASLEVVSSLPAAVVCSRIALSVEPLTAVPPPARKHSKATERQNGAATAKQNKSELDRCDKQLVKGNREDVRPVNPLLTRLNITERLDLQEDKSLAAANVVCKNSKQCLRRQDSQGRCRKPSTVNRGDFSRTISAENITLQPGHNNVSLKAKAQEVGYFRLSQLSLLLEGGGLEFVSPPISPRLCYQVTGAAPSVTIHSSEALVAGPKHSITLIINTASYVLQEKSSIFLRSTAGSTLQWKESDSAMERHLEIPLPAFQPFSTLTFPLIVQAHLPPQKVNNSIEHIISVRCPWGEEEKQIPLQFQPPLTSVCRLHTACMHKFLHVCITGLNSQPLHLTRPTLTIVSHPHVRLESLIPAQPQSIVLASEQKIGFMWELDPNCFEDTPPLKTEFSVSYSTSSEESAETNVYKCPFDIINYKTLFVVESRVEPTKGNEFCRASTLCHLQLAVQRVNASADTSLMYEVLADQTMWAVCGRTAGVITLETGERDRHSVMLDVMPLINGYLPLPLVRLSKYIPADAKLSNKTMNPDSHPRLEPFSPGQVYNSSKGTQVHVIAAVTT